MSRFIAMMICMVVLITVLGCELKRGRQPGHATCYSYGRIIYDSDITTSYGTAEDGYTVDDITGKTVRINGDCVIKY
jgi:hypothetical protein